MHDLSAWRRAKPVTDPLIAAAVFVLRTLPLIRTEQCGCADVPGWAYALVAGQ
ncbi:MAG: hypothetical protein M3419_01500 [Actinomycetota bacterium]|nr:hypothetical protein [Actinomycetota bacterium]